MAEMKSGKTVGLTHQTWKRSDVYVEVESVLTILSQTESKTGFVQSRSLRLDSAWKSLSLENLFVRPFKSSEISQNWAVHFLKTEIGLLWQRDDNYHMRHAD